MTTLRTQCRAGVQHKTAQEEHKSTDPDQRRTCTIIKTQLEGQIPALNILSVRGPRNQAFNSLGHPPYHTILYQTTQLAAPHCCPHTASLSKLSHSTLYHTPWLAPPHTLQPLPHLCPHLENFISPSTSHTLPHTIGSSSPILLFPLHLYPCPHSPHCTTHHS